MGNQQATDDRETVHGGWDAAGWGSESKKFASGDSVVDAAKMGHRTFGKGSRRR